MSRVKTFVSLTSTRFRGVEYLVEKLKAALNAVLPERGIKDSYTLQVWIEATIITLTIGRS